MKKTRRVMVPGLVTAGLLWSGIFMLAGCDGGSSASANFTPDAQQKAALEKANADTAAAHPRHASKKPVRR